MRLIKKSIERDGSGSVTLFPEEPEDMVSTRDAQSALCRDYCASADVFSPQWHAYNLIRPTDLLRASAMRRVTTESATGATSSVRVHTTLTIRVRSLDFDPQAGQLHVSGQIAEENKYTKLGQFHTLDLELNRNFQLEKADGWDSVALDMLKEAVDPEKGADAVAVVMQEGLANICFVTSYQTILKSRIEAPIPRKRAGRASDHDNGLKQFFQKTLETLLRQIDLSDSKPILIASPGFTATSFLKYINETAVTTANKELIAAKSNFLVVHSSSGHVHALNEVLKSPEVLVRLKDTKYAKETKVMDDFFDLLRKDDGRAWYGPKEVEKAVEKGAVGRGGGVLLISNDLFRSQEIETRRRWVRLVDRVKDEEGGDVRVLISEHESGRRLEGLGGIAAILTFPIDEDEMGDNDDDEVETNDDA
jgi:protein pelota